jgi:hypothetical protein
MTNGRCWAHGGLSTGPRTAEGLERSRKARLRHGCYSTLAKAERQQARRELQQLRQLVSTIRKIDDPDEWPDETALFAGPSPSHAGMASGPGIKTR